MAGFFTLPAEATSTASCINEAITLAPVTVPYITDTTALTALVADFKRQLIHDPRLGIDTEFIREKTYAPVLEIVQLAVSTPEGIQVALVDIPALQGQLDPLAELLLDTTVLKIVHSGSQDVEILTALLGRMPSPLYDTQVAAAFAGYSLQTGYGALVQSVLNVRLSKEEGFSDWSRRPLTRAMLDYAENDVRYLHALHDRLTALLSRRNRENWAAEQTERLLEQAAKPLSPENLWRRVSGRNVLDSRGLALLRALAIWRDEEARRRDKPRRTVAKDEALVEIARRAPQTAQAVLALRGAPANLGERAAEAIAGCVRQTLASPKTDWPQPETPLALNEQEAALVELLSAVVRVRAAEEHLPPSLLASTDDLRQLAASASRLDRIESELLGGWRARLIGEELRAVLAGEATVAWNRQKKRLLIHRTSGEAPQPEA